jgi:uncharacterized protein YcnI
MTTRGPQIRSFAAKLGIGAVIGVTAVLLAAGSASAHVKVSGTDTAEGGYGVLGFRVPTESATASTVGLTVTFPTSSKIVSASTQPMAGWTATVDTKKLAHEEQTDDGEVDTYVASVTWKADSRADGVPPGEFQIFNVSVGALPDKPSVSFPSLQTYSDGSTVNWNESSSGGAEPEHPAPVLTLEPAASATAGTSTTAAGPTVAASSSHGTSSGSSSWPGVVGLIAGILGLIAGLIALARTYRKPTPRQ